MQLPLLLQLEGGKNPHATRLFGLCHKFSGKLVGGREPSVGSAGRGGEQQAVELSYFPEVLVCEADSSVGGEGFVFRAANSPKASRGPVHRFALQSGQGNRESEAAEAQQRAWRETACQSKGTDCEWCFLQMEGWMDRWTGTALSG